MFSGAGLLSPPCQWIYHHAHGSGSQFLFTTILRRSGSLACWPVTCGSGSTLDAASHLRDFHTIIDEMRATLKCHELKEYDAGNQCDEEEDREWLLRLLEDVMRTVQHLAERDTAVLSVRTTLLLRATVPHLV